MKKIFKNDYNIICHQEILNAIIKYKDEANEGYGLDKHSLNAEKLILDTFGLPNGKVHFVTGGTQANLLVISYLLKPYEGVLCVDSGHINVHETAAVEGTGHKIFSIPNVDGKLTASNLKNVLKINNNEHMVKIKMVYISNSTEKGTVYNYKELSSIYKICKENNLYLFVDGARLSSALSSEYNDMKPQEFADSCDIFIAGGTKIGAMMGEAIAFKNKEMATDFRYAIKNRGAMQSKGFVNGIQFERLFEDDLYFKLGKQENELAYYLTKELTKLNVKLDVPTVTNQIFPILSKKDADELIKYYDYEIWEDRDEDVVIRLVTSFHSTKEEIDEFIEVFKGVIKWKKN